MQGPDTDAQDQPPPFIHIRLATHGRSIQLGHVWTAPWQELSDVFAALVGCGHVFGLSMRRGLAPALMIFAGWGPNKKAHASNAAGTQAGFSPTPEGPILFSSALPLPMVFSVHLL